MLSIQPEIDRVALEWKQLFGLAIDLCLSPMVPGTSRRATHPRPHLCLPPIPAHTSVEHSTLSSAANWFSATLPAISDAAAYTSTEPLHQSVIDTSHYTTVTPGLETRTKRLRFETKPDQTAALRNQTRTKPKNGFPKLPKPSINALGTNAYL